MKLVDAILGEEISSPFVVFGFAIATLSTEDPRRIVVEQMSDWKRRLKPFETIFGEREGSGMHANWIAMGCTAEQTS